MSKKQDPRVLRTRKLLREALLELIREQGFENISVQDITERATLNRTTFYLHYADKQDLLRQAVGDVLDEIRTLPMPISPVQPDTLLPERLREFAVALFTHVARHAAFYQVMLGESSVAPFALEIQDKVTEIGLKWIARSRTSQATTPELTMNMISGAYIGMIRWWVTNDLQHTPEHMADLFLSLITTGMAQAMRGD